MEQIGPYAMIVGSLVVIVVLAVLFFWLKGRRRPGEHVFRASRLSPGNRLFPTQVAITPSSVVHYTPQWVGRFEHVTHIAHVASVRIDTGLLFSDVYIETSGGANPIRCSGHKKSDAIKMQALVERYQSDYYKGRAEGASPSAPSEQHSSPLP
jgi:hypothetical protein